MATKNVSVDFYRMDSEEFNYLKVFSDKLEISRDILMQKNRENIKLFDFFVRFYELTFENNYWIGHIEKVKTEEYAVVGSLDGRRDTYATQVDEGPVSDSTFLFWPDRRIIALYRSREGLSHRAFEAFLSRYTGLAISLSVILSEDKALRLSKMRLVKQLEYKIAKPTNMEFAKSKNTGFFQEAEIIRQLQSDSMDIIIASGRGKKLDKTEVIKKAESLASYKDEGVEKVKIKGREFDGGPIDTVDLIQDRMIYVEKLTIPKDKKITPIMMMDVLRKAFDKKKSEIVRMYLDER
ncbi:DUF6731 family protein [Paenibacillus ehimensis]|uniref:Uncharacterized protein n=1 Tax=Paenibacillus ehimensis TaxID=79264 RepID=A0ABT8V2Y1_9BACL|nr:DUF6731 family protein [Paenibacillus ehimensis]MDO3675790.1 hypothetical protein [Paenibacillus ehimensis]